MDLDRGGTPSQRHGRFATLVEFATAWRDGSREEFIAAIPCLLLLEIATMSEVGIPTRRSTVITTRTEMYRTANAHVFFLEKNLEAGGVPEVLTVGRCPTNDLVLPYPDVSKLHAFFHASEGGWVVVDASSTNGTEVGGERLSPATPKLLRPDRAPVGIRFGPILCELLTPAEFWARASFARD